MSYGDNIGSSNSLRISDWWYTFIGSAGGLRIWDTFVYQDAALEADLVLISEKLGSGAFTFCFPSAGHWH